MGYPSRSWPGNRRSRLPKGLVSGSSRLGCRNASHSASSAGRPPSAFRASRSGQNDRGRKQGCAASTNAVPPTETAVTMTDSRSLYRCQRSHFERTSMTPVWTDTGWSRVATSACRRRAFRNAWKSPRRAPMRARCRWWVAAEMPRDSAVSAVGRAACSASRMSRQRCRVSGRSVGRRAVPRRIGRDPGSVPHRLHRAVCSPVRRYSRALAPSSQVSYRFTPWFWHWALGQSANGRLRDRK